MIYVDEFIDPVESKYLIEFSSRSRHSRSSKTFMSDMRARVVYFWHKQMEINFLMVLECEIFLWMATIVSSGRSFTARQQRRTAVTQLIKFGMTGIAPWRHSPFLIGSNYARSDRFSSRCVYRWIFIAGRFKFLRKSQLFQLKEIFLKRK